MNKLARELKKERKKSVDQESKMMDSILNDANQLLLEAHDNDREILGKLGLDHQIQYSKMLQRDITRTRLAEKHYNQETYTGEQIKVLCHRYDLKILKTSEYNGSIPVDLTRKVKAFCEKNDLPIKQNSFWILAPQEQFDTVTNVPKQRDPILFYLVDAENMSSSHKEKIYSDDKLINVHYWGNDFSFLRRFRWLFSTFQDYSDDFPIRSRTILILSFLFVMTLANIFMYLPLSLNIFVSLVMLIPLNFSLNYKRKLDSYWNNNTNTR
jgi:hypothetical protein